MLRSHDAPVTLTHLQRMEAESIQTMAGFVAGTAGVAGAAAETGEDVGWTST